MVQIASLALFCLLLAPSLAVPISNDQELHARSEDLVERNWFKSIFRSAKRLVTPSNLAKVASFVIRDDESRLMGRDLEELTERDIEELMQRNWFNSIIGGVKKVATPSNIGRVASFVIREDAEELSHRELEYLEDLSAREPSVASFFRKVKNFFRPSNIDKAADTAKTISNLVREDEVGDLAERDIGLEEELSARELEDLEDLAARDPTFGAILEKLVSREEGDIFERDYEMEDLD